MKKKNLIIVLLLSSLLIFVFLYGKNRISEPNDEIFIKIATGNIGGTYYPVGVVMGQLFSNKLSYITSSAMATGGSVDNIGFLRSNEVQLAILSSPVILDAYLGKGEFKDKKYENLRAITSMWPSLQHIVVHKDIQRIEDLKGKKFVVGATRSGTEVDAHAILASLGLYYRDEDSGRKNFVPIYVNYEEAVEAMKNNQVAGGLFDSAPPGSAIAELMATGDFHILSFTNEELTQLSSNYPLFNAYTIKAGTYPKQTEDIKTPGYPVVLVTSKDMDRDVVYNLSKTIFEHLSVLESADKAAEYIRVETATKGVPIEFHEGAKKYLDEKGVWKQ